MTLREFNKLDADTRAQIFCEQGVYLASRNYQSEVISLWQIEDFYVELVYDEIGDNILKLRGFLSPIPMEPYLKQIELTQLTL